jgi:ABC-type multidrug transport system ATPase subunit
MRLEIQNVKKRYQGNFWGLKNINLNIENGVLGLLGPNGAGKSTLMRILATITKATDGKVTWEGIDIAKQPNQSRKVLGYLPQDFGVYPNLNAKEFLEYMAAIKGIKKQHAKRRIQELLELVNLHEAGKRPLGGYSGGMRQRIGIAQALLNDPKLLIVDEPTVGLDPEERIRFRNLLSDLSGDRIIIFSTHIVSDIEAIATELAVIAEGCLLTYIKPEELLQAVAGKVWECIIPSSDLQVTRDEFQISNIMRCTEGIQLRIVENERPLKNAKLVSPTLEDAYLYFVANHRRTD